MTRTEKAQARAASEARMAAHRATTAASVAARACPCCGSVLRRNTSLTGWWQCSQFGAVGFRADANKPSCDWQGFTA